MSELEKIERYISLTKPKMKRRDLYNMRLGEICALRDASDINRFDALCTAFDYGMAKGYRMAKKEARG